MVKRRREIEKLGHVKLYDAFDGAPYCEETSRGRVRFMDLTIPQFGIRQYDWIISLEVAEHIPKKYEAVYLSLLNPFSLMTFVTYSIGLLFI
jgi:hypothetical protein